MAVVEPVVKLDDIVARYVALRDKKAQLKAKYDADVAEIERGLERCEAYFLQRMQEQGLEALPTSAGTAYKSVQRSFKVADWDSFLPFVREHGLWTMLEKRAAKSAVEEYVTAHNDLPPGLDSHAKVVVNVRRS